jgi:putative ABC transport system ATP-binding protein
LTVKPNEILILGNLNKFGVTVIIVTHEHEIAAKTKRQIYIKDGQVESIYNMASSELLHLAKAAIRGFQAQ